MVGDWSHSQYRIAAGICRDEELMEALAPGRDLYCTIGQLALGAVPPHVGRPIGKALALPLLYGAGAGRLGRTPHHRQPGVILTLKAAKALLASFATAYPTLVAHRASCAGLERFTTPLGYQVEIPEDSGNERAVMAGIIQAREADALRWALQHADTVMAGTGARVALVNQDESVWEVPVEHAQEAARRAEGWMLECLGWACAPCAPAVKVEVRSNWAKVVKP